MCQLHVEHKRNYMSPSYWVMQKRDGNGLDVDDVGSQ
jgi:hypothetical protein